MVAVGAPRSTARCWCSPPASGWRGLLPGSAGPRRRHLQPAPRTRRPVGDAVRARCRRSCSGRPAVVAARGRRRARGSSAGVAGLPDQVRGLLPGLIDGDTSDLDPVLAERFKLAGLTHLVAVSGTNCSILIGAVLLVLRRLRVRRGWCALAGRGRDGVRRRRPPVAERAAGRADGAVSRWSRSPPGVRGRRCPRWRRPCSGCWSGIRRWRSTPASRCRCWRRRRCCVFAPGWAAALRERRVPVGVAESVAVAAAAHLVTAPVIAAISGRVSLVADPGERAGRAGRRRRDRARFPRRARRPAGDRRRSVARLAGRLAVPLAGLGGRLVRRAARRHAVVAGRCDGRLALLVATVRCGCSPAGPVPGGSWRPREPWRWSCRSRSARSRPAGRRRAGSSWPATWARATLCVLRAGPHGAVEIDAGPGPGRDRPLPARPRGHRHPAARVHPFPPRPRRRCRRVVRGRHVGRVLTGPLADPPLRRHDVDTALAPRGLRVPMPTHRARSSTSAPSTWTSSGRPAAFHGTRSDPNNSSLVLRARSTACASCCPVTPRWRPNARCSLRRRPRRRRAEGAAPRFGLLRRRLPGRGARAGRRHQRRPAQRLRPSVARAAGHDGTGCGVPVRRTDVDGDVAVCGPPGQPDRGRPRRRGEHGRSERAPAGRPCPGTAGRRRRRAVPGWRHGRPPRQPDDLPEPLPAARPAGG